MNEINSENTEIMQILDHHKENFQQENRSSNKTGIIIAENMNNTNKNMQVLYVK